MDERNAARQELVAELEAAEREFWKTFSGVVRRWVLFPQVPAARGPRLHSGGIGLLVWTLHAALLSTGVVLSLASTGGVRGLGLSLVVGSLFGVGAVAAQVWSVAYQKEQALLQRALGDVAYEDVLVQGARIQELAAQVKALEQG
ncbi:hypothetical protein [Actinomadura rupiterrae]|uniref:hypothetical protein n=1 Tax=Actinomadura rupiterrae TaxID=559627 RepID=UPI0020A50F62|nr:hypothetical protein [Actinomadura rupiterrae]MCP2340747.1 hypothetical protein [Actinomadura rupiterrae]